MTIAVALVLLVLTVSGCASTGRQPLQAAANNVWVGYGPLFLAQDLGYLDARQVRVHELPASSDVITAWRNGAIDVAALTLDEALAIAETDDAVRIVMVTDISNGADMLVAKPGIEGVAGLRGARIGVERSAVGAYLLTRALGKAGLTVRDVTVVLCPIDRHQELFASGQVDAVVTYEPVGGALVEQGGAVVFDSSKIPGEIVDVLVVRADVLSERRDDVDALIDAWFRAVGYAADNPGPAIALMAKRCGVEETDFEQAIAGLDTPSRERSDNLVGGKGPGLLPPAQMLEQIMRDSSLLEKAVDPSVLFEGVETP